MRPHTSPRSGKICAPDDPRWLCAVSLPTLDKTFDLWSYNSLISLSASKLQYIISSEDSTENASCNIGPSDVNRRPDVNYLIGMRLDLSGTIRGLHNQGGCPILYLRLEYGDPDLYKSEKLDTHNNYKKSATPYRKSPKSKFRISANAELAHFPASEIWGSTHIDFFRQS